MRNAIKTLCSPVNHLHQKTLPTQYNVPITIASPYGTRIELAC